MSSRCDRPNTGWFCGLARNHKGACPTYPRWWNLRRINLYIKWESWKHEFAKPYKGK